jgi:hypothetical protein
MSGQTNLLTSWEAKEESLEGGFRVTRIHFGGDRHVMAILGAVVERYNVLSERPRPNEDDLKLLIGSKVTLIRTGENMLGSNMLVAQEGKLFEGSGGMGILPKGARSKGFRVQPEYVLDVLPGYDTAQAEELVGKVRSHFPQVQALTQERLAELPTNSETLGLCMFGTYRMPWGSQTDALYLASEYFPTDDIVQGIVLLRGENGVSEHGSVYGQDLLRTHVFGEVVGYEPITFGEGIALCDLPFDAAYERLLGNCVAA